MTTLPAEEYFSTAGRTNSQAKAAQNMMLAFIKDIAGSDSASKTALVSFLQGASLDINNGTWNGTIDGAWTAAGQTCTNLGTVTFMDCNGGTMDGTTIGGTSPAAGAFTSLGVINASANASIAIDSNHATYGSALNVTMAGSGVQMIYGLAESGNYAQHILNLSCARTSSNAFNFVLFTSNSGATTEHVMSGDGSTQNRLNSYGGTSDARLKQDVTPSSSQWDDVRFLATSLVKYRLREDVNRDPSAPSMLGFVAQQIVGRCPGLVGSNPEYRDEMRPTGRMKRVPTGFLDANENPLFKEEPEFEAVRVPTGESTYYVKYSIVSLKALGALGEVMDRVVGLEEEIRGLKEKVVALEGGA